MAYLAFSNQEKIAILLVLYNDTNHISKIIRSIQNQTYKRFEIYAIETSESGNSIKLLKELYPEANIYPDKGNLGFAGGNNYLAEKAYKDGANFFFVLNTDMELSSNTLEVLVSYFNAENNIGVVGTTILFGDSKKIQLFGAKANFKNQKKRFIYPNSYIDEISLPEELEVDYVNGGSTFLSRKVYEKVGLFNEDFFMYNDEIEFAYKVRSAGFKTIVTSKTFIRHYHDFDNLNNSGYYLMCYYRNRNRCLYFREHQLILYFMIDVVKELFKIPLVFFLNTKNSGLKYFYYYYLGLIHGILNKKGQVNLSFK